MEDGSYTPYNKKFVPFIVPSWKIKSMAATIPLFEVKLRVYWCSFHSKVTSA
jgi:hypothetical protein